MKTILALLCGFLTIATSQSAQDKAVLPKGHVYFQTDFEGATATAPFKSPGSLADGFKGGKSLFVELKPGSVARSSIASMALPVEQMRGYTIRVSALVKAEGVTAKPNPWNGIKVMMPLEAPSQKSWPQAEIETGTSDWKKVSFSSRVPDDATSAMLCLGLEEVRGRVWFDDIVVSVVKAPVSVKPNAAAGPVFKGHDLPRLRGTMISADINAEALRVLGQDWKANLIRWQLTRHAQPGKAGTLDDYDQWLEGELKKLDAALPLCERYGILVVIDLHSPPGGKATQGGYVGSDDRLFTSKVCQERFIEVWKKMAVRYKNSKAVWGYDLVNEPVENLVEEDCDDWQALAEKTAKAIRGIDPKRAIIVEPAPWGGPDGLKDFAPIDVPNVVYSVHMYVPHDFTHQGVYSEGKGVVYPGLINGKDWGKTQLEEVLQPVADFQRKFGVHIYIGEFSAIRWAPDDSAHPYLKDCIELFEEFGWDWSYHAFREWSGWSVEHGPDKADTAPSKTQTNREKLLREGDGKNVKTK